MSGAATLRRPPSNQPNRDPMEAIPNSNLIDSAMYERDKQIYKCSTLRQGGKFDPRNFGVRMPAVAGPNGMPAQAAAAKPSILNCPLPEIPKEYANGEPNNTTSPPRNFSNNNNMAGQPTMTR